MICLSCSITQRGLHVQFDDLFKNAWDEDVVVEQEENGIWSTLNPFFTYVLCMGILPLYYKYNQMNQITAMNVDRH